MALPLECPEADNTIFSMKTTPVLMLPGYTGLIIKPSLFKNPHEAWRETAMNACPPFEASTNSSKILSKNHATDSIIVITARISYIVLFKKDRILCRHPQYCHRMFDLKLVVTTFEVIIRESVIRSAWIAHFHSPDRTAKVKSFHLAALPMQKTLFLLL